MLDKLRKPRMLTLTDSFQPARLHPVAAVQAVPLKARRTKRVVERQDDWRWPELIARIRDQADTEAFAALFNHFAPRVKAFLIKGGAPAALAEECAQDVMATVWQKAALFDASRASVATWIFTIARNRRIDTVRRDRVVEPEDVDWGPEQLPDQAEAYDASEDAARLGVALRQLPEPQRKLVERAFWGDLSHSEIAAETGLPLGTIKSRIRLALERLRQSLGADE